VVSRLTSNTSLGASVGVRIGNGNSEFARDKLFLFMLGFWDTGIWEWQKAWVAYQIGCSCWLHL
jgi:hypothetical protein